MKAQAESIDKDALAKEAQEGELSQQFKATEYIPSFLSSIFRENPERQSTVGRDRRQTL